MTSGISTPQAAIANASSAPRRASAASPRRSPSAIAATIASAIRNSI